MELERGAGTQFDPEVAAVMVTLVRSGEIVVPGPSDRTSSPADDPLSRVSLRPPREARAAPTP
jgi:hypothetical protein